MKHYYRKKEPESEFYQQLRQLCSLTREDDLLFPSELPQLAERKLITQPVGGYHIATSAGVALLYREGFLRGYYPNTENDWSTVSLVGYRKTQE